MLKTKKITVFIFLLFFLTAGFFEPVFSKEKLEIDFFYSPTCPHCVKERAFLEQIKNNYSGVELKEFNIFEKKNLNLLKKIYEQYGIEKEMQGLIPLTLLGENYFFGYDSDEITGKKIEEYIQEYLKEGEGGGAIGNISFEQLKENIENMTTRVELREEIRLPIIGEINISSLSPLALSVIFGALDGFNACAMVVLGFLLAVLVATKMRKRVLLVGGTFILVSGIVYFLFISAWLNLFLALGGLGFITFLVGAIVIIFSIFLLKDYLHGVICKLCQVGVVKEGFFTKIEKKLFLKMEKLASSKASLPAMLLGVSVVAAGVNMVELVCSFGFPLAFTKILVSSSITGFYYYLYILIYIFFYMLDDLIIFLIALLSLRITQISEKYLKAVKLISGIFLLILGLLIIFKPELLVFVN